MSDNKLNSMGFAKPPSKTRVVVAMSGGVDSSVTAALLHKEGYEVIGVTMQLYDHGEVSNNTLNAPIKSKTCCAGQDIYDARKVADDLGFPHYVLNYESNFRESVIDDFADSYLRGETPIPCIKCNQSVKFRDMLNFALDLGADCMATGHYIQRTIDKDGVAHLLRAHDDHKDQSYFLFATTRKQLDFLRFPLGGWSKDITRKHAKNLGLLNADKPDSQDICFVPDGNYAKIVKKIRPNAEKAGKIIHLDGRIIGDHNGIIHYTIGQRKGLGIGGGFSDNNQPLYVVKLDPQENLVIVGSKDDLACNILKIANCNWLLPSNNDGDNNQPINVMVKFRSTMQPMPAVLHIKDNNGAKLRLSAPQFGIATGQAAVCYIEDRMIGGGWIIDALNNDTKEQ